MATTGQAVTASSEIELGSPRSEGERLFMVACCLGVLGLGLWMLFSAASGLQATSSDGERILTVSIGAFGLGMLWLALRPTSAVYELWDRLYAGPDGVRAGAGGRNCYRWSDIAGFETLPTRGTGPRAVMDLHDGRRVSLRALREVDDGFGNPTNPGAVDEDVRRLSNMLREHCEPRA